MMGKEDFRRLKSDFQVTLDIQRQFDEQEHTRGGNLIKHNIGWTIRARKPKTTDDYGYFHVHWAPKDAHSAINHNISAHFKPNHAGPKANNKGNPTDLPLEEAALLYNHFVMLNASWSAHKSADQSRPTNAKTGWTPLTTRITETMVNNFRATNNQAAMKNLMQNPLYELNRWDHDAWNSYMWWMAGA
jgi:hypothetical protein